jgi:hypothetical protein
MKRTRATPGELTIGIGFQVATPPPGWHADPWASRASECRRGAAAMRSQRFASEGWRLMGVTDGWLHPADVQEPGSLGTQRPGDRFFVAAWVEELERGCPAWRKP